MAEIEVIDSSGLLTEEELNEFIRHAGHLEHPREMIIDILRTVQKNHGWVPDSGIELTARILGLTPLEVEEIATFYDKIFRHPVGRHVIHICDSICCWSRGGEELAAHLQQRLQIEFGQTTADGLFTLLPSCCLGGCGKAPGVMIGQTFYGELTPDKVDRLLAELSQEAQE
ncbi:NADH-quinone oxidoreductase subunit NuoE [Pelobacter seleniigenes]|uniref:NADH-quinone oxidoreductase subunit NuoE n=1 Tax=Pelobacter seleniigenes TaxID=407188 RepID=UPI0004A774D9|nr:NADH-quinone oxidoreductase subunit NuoE [Pelobacter seleniigenes]